MKTAARSRRGLFCFAALALIFLVSTVEQARAGKGDEKVIGIYLESIGGRSSSGDFDVLQGVVKAINSYGYNLKARKFSSHEEVKNAFIAKQIDAAALWPGHVVEIMASGRKLHPSLTYIHGNKEKVSYCLWHKKGQGGKDISAVNGKKLIIVESSPFVLIQLRDFLASKGVDKPLWRVFGALIYSKSMNSAYMALAAGEADFLWDNSDGDYFMKMLNPNVSAQLTHDFCSETTFARGAIIVIDESRSGAEFCNQFDTDMKTMMKNSKQHADKDPGLKALIQYLKLTKTKIVLAKPDEYETEYKLYLKAKNNGWLDEAKFIYEKMKGAHPGTAVEIKMDYKTCRTMCAGKKNEVKCVSDCMK